MYAAAAFAAVALVGCEEKIDTPAEDPGNTDDEEQVTPPDVNGEQTMTLEASSDAVTLDAAKLSETALTFTWTAARELPEEYEVSYSVELALASDTQFANADKKTVEDGLTVSYTHEKLQTLVTDTWAQPMGQAVELTFRVTASWTGGDQEPKPEVCTANVTVTPYIEEMTLPDFAAESVSLSGAGLSAGVAVSKTLENDAVYAVVQTLEAGKLSIPVQTADGAAYICPAEGDGAFQDGVAVPAVMKNVSYAWTIPSAGDYRIVINMTDKTVTIYSPENEFNRNYVIEEWYIAGKPANHPNPVRNTEVTELWLRGHWDDSNPNQSWGWSKGRKLDAVQSAADPQVLVYSGDALWKGTENHLAVMQSIVFDSGNGNGEITWDINNVPVIAPARIDEDGDGYNDTAKRSVEAVLGEWMDMSVGSDLREVFWSTPDGVNFIVVDLRNMKIKMETR